MTLRSITSLRASEERLQAIVDNRSAVILVKDLELRYILVNHEIEGVPIQFEETVPETEDSMRIAEGYRSYLLGMGVKHY